jgi:hypothetical protein
LRERLGTLREHWKRCLWNVSIGKLSARLDEHFGRLLRDHAAGQLRDQRGDPQDVWVPACDDEPVQRRTGGHLDRGLWAADAVVLW